MEATTYFVALATLLVIIGLYIWLRVYRRPVDPCVVYSLGGDDECQLSGDCETCRPAAVFQRRQVAYLEHQKWKVGLQGPCAECRHKEHAAMACRSCFKLWDYTDPERRHSVNESFSEAQL